MSGKKERSKGIKDTKKDQQRRQVHDLRLENSSNHTVENDTSDKTSKPSEQQESSIREELNKKGVFELLSSLGQNDEDSARLSDHETLQDEDAHMLLNSNPVLILPSWTDSTANLQPLISYNRAILKGPYESPEYALWMAVGTGSLSQVDYILKSAASFARLCSSSDCLLLDQNILNHGLWDYHITTFSGSPSIPSFWDQLPGGNSRLTILMTAIKTCNTQIVQSLLEYGVDADVLTPHGTALSLAAMLDFPDIIQLLLKGGADVTNALVFIRTMYSTMEISSGETATQIQMVFDRLLNFTKIPVVEDRIRRLHEEFLLEHSRIRELCRQPFWARSFPYNIANDRRAAWSTGFNVLRKLAKEDVSHTTYEVIIFLSIVKSICAVEDAEDPTQSICLSRFKKDLDRWQMLFAEDKDKLDEFREIVELLWNLKLVDWRDVPPDTSTSIEFQKLVVALIANAAPLFKDGTQRAANVASLLSSQERWRRKHQQHPHIPGDSVERLPPEKSKPPWEEVQGIGVPKTEMRDESGLRAADAKNIAHASSGSLVILLMAGAIFGIFIAFLISMNSLNAAFLPHHANESRLK